MKTFNLDHFLFAGKSHRCQDFVLTKNTGSRFVVIADGCSGSEMTEIGSMVLAATCYSFLASIDNIDIDNTDWLLSMFEKIIHSAHDHINQWILPSHVLDSTLLICIETAAAFLVHVHGDGYILQERGGGLGWHVTKLSYINSRPHYLSYRLDSKRQELYKKENGDNENTFQMETISAKSRNCSPLKYDCSFTGIYAKENFNTILIASDGIGSFKTPENQTPDENNLFASILGFKSFKGQFLERRMRKILGDFKKDRMDNYDDISIAGFTVDPRGEDEMQD